MTFAREAAAASGVLVHASLYEKAPALDGTDDGLGFNTAVLVAPDGQVVARTRKTHIPVTAGYHEDKYFRQGPPDDAYPVYDLADLAGLSGHAAARDADLLGRVVPGGRAGVQPGRCPGARLPDGDRVRAGPPRLRHPAAVAAHHRGPRDRQRPLRRRAQPLRHRGAHHLLRLVLHRRPLRAGARAGAPRRGGRPRGRPRPRPAPGTGSTSSRSSRRAARTPTPRSPNRSATSTGGRADRGAVCRISGAAGGCPPSGRRTSGPGWRGPARATPSATPRRMPTRPAPRGRRWRSPSPASNPSRSSSTPPMSASHGAGSVRVGTAGTGSTCSRHRSTTRGCVTSGRRSSCPARASSGPSTGCSTAGARRRGRRGRGTS